MPLSSRDTRRFCRACGLHHRDGGAAIPPPSQLESKVIGFDEFKSVLGLVVAFLIVIAAFVWGAYTALNGKPLFVGVISLAGLAAVVGPFIYQRRQGHGWRTGGRR
jgi:hypothetical protein